MNTVSFKGRHNAKAIELLKYVNKELERLPCVDARKCPEVTGRLSDMSELLLIDINIYSRQGKLIATSRPEIFEYGFEGTLVDPEALKQIEKLGVTSYIANGKVGELTYMSAYMPLVLDNGKSYILNIPYFAQNDELNLDIICRPVEVGYSLRCVDPSAFDLTYCTTLGIGVKKLYDEGHSGCMVAVNLEEEVIPVYLKDVEDEHGKIRTRLVNIDKEVVRQTLTENIYYLTAQDRSLARKWLADPEPFEYERILGLSLIHI